MGSRRVIVRLRVRRYFCDRKSCSRKTFVEQVPGLSERHRRSSTGLTGWLRSIAIELGGPPAARLCRRLRLIAGRTRRLRLLTAPTAPRALICLAEIREKDGDRDAAETLYRQAADHARTDPGAGPGSYLRRTNWLFERLWPYGLDPDGTPTSPWQLAVSAPFNPHV
ncbi:hypothetical protein SUDANB9_07769 [Streptomyces sp. enrichment culture]